MQALEPFVRLVASCPPQLCTIRQSTQKNKKIQKIKSIDKVKQGDYAEVFKGSEAKKFPLFCAPTIPSLCFGLIFVRGKLNPANRGGLNFWKYTPL